MGSSIASIPDEILIEEAKRRDKERQLDKKPREVMRECLGCGKQYNARDMRSHSCVVGWTKRISHKLVKDGEDYTYVIDDPAS
jgi:hypothetical protein